MGFTRALQLKHPVVLVHGLGARHQFGGIEYFYGLSQLLREAKNEFLIAQLTAFHTIEFRAAELKHQIESRFPEGKVNLLGHSMGGLDCRYLISKLGFADRVASLTTIGTPHRGTSASDFAIEKLPPAVFLAMDQLLKKMDSSTGAFEQIGRSYCNGPFAEDTPNCPTVAYYSATSAIAQPLFSKALPIFWISHQFIRKIEGDNDGFVSVESAKWGEHICTYSGDHYAQIGQILGRARGMDYLQFYHEILSRLKQDGM